MLVYAVIMKLVMVFFHALVLMLMGMILIR